MIAAIQTWLAAHPVARGVLWGILVLLAPAITGAVYNWMTYKRTAEEWIAYQKAHPYRALFIRVSRAVWPHLKKIPQLRPFFPDEPAPKDKP